MTRLGFVALLSASMLTTPGAQAPRDTRAAVAAGGASIAGLVVSGPNRAPLRRAVITLSGSELGVARLALTGDDGRFTFGHLTAGRYTITAARPGFVTTHYGSRRPGAGPGTPIAIADTEQLRDLSIDVLPGAVIAGATLDERGRPRATSAMSLLAVRGSGSARTLTPVATTTADDQGAYRFFGVAPGSYLVAARADVNFTAAIAHTPQEIDAALRGGPASPSAPPARPIAYTATLHPSTVDPSAATIVTVQAGEERTGIDVRFLVAATARLEGRIVDQNGRPPRGLQLSVISPAFGLGLQARASLGTMQPTTLVLTSAGDGRFSRSAMTPGHYTFVARAVDPAVAPSNGRTGGPATPTLWAITEIDIDGRDVPDLTITLQPGMTVNGRLVADGAGTPDLTRVQVRLVSLSRSVTLGVAPVMAVADGTFTFRGVAPGDYAVAIAAPGGWTMARATVGAADAIDQPITVASGRDVDDLVVQLTTRPTGLTGMITDVLGRPAPDLIVVVTSADNRQWTYRSPRTRETRPASTGHYTLTGLPPGDYYIAAVTAIEPGDLEDSTFLAMIAGASIRTTVTAGQMATLDLRIASDRR